jgi:hypothetical protein
MIDPTASCSSESCVCTDPEEDTPAPTPGPTANAYLTAYWDMGRCGPFGDDRNMDWCSGNPKVCQSEVSVSTSVCSSGAAELTSFQGTGNWGSVTIDGCKYGFYAQYACTIAPAPGPTPPTPEPTPGPTAPSELTAYWDMGNCGVFGDDHNMGWCSQGSNNRWSCPSEVSTSACSTGTASLKSFLGTGKWGSITMDGCKYGFYAQYECVIGEVAPPPEPTPAPTAPAELTAYWDMSNCGVFGDDHNMGWCSKGSDNSWSCPSEVSTSACNTGTASLKSFSGTGKWGSITMDGCRYGFYAQYECVLGLTPEPTPDLGVPTPEPTPGPTAPAELTAYWDMGNCGVFGNDHNMGWCSKGSDNKWSCPSEVSTSACGTGTASLKSFLGTGKWGSITMDGCKYGFFAQYECVIAPTPAPTASSDLSAYWDMGNCGVFGDDHNLGWCSIGSNNEWSCPGEISTSACSSGTASLKSFLGNGKWGSLSVDGCKYGFFAEYACVSSASAEEAVAPQPAPAPTSGPDLSAYWDMESCGMYGNDHHMSWCSGPAPWTCPSQITISTSVCSSGAATLTSFQGTGRWASLTIDGCKYAFFAEYTCTEERRLLQELPPELVPGLASPKDMASPQEATITSLAAPAVATSAAANYAVIAALCTSGLLVAAVAWSRSMQRKRQQVAGGYGRPSSFQTPTKSRRPCKTSPSELAEDEGSPAEANSDALIVNVQCSPEHPAPATTVVRESP